MKKIGIIILGLTVAFLAHAQEKETRTLGSFDELNISQRIDVIIEEGNEEKVVVEVKGANLNQVLTKVMGSELEIKMDEGNYNPLSITVYITYKSLKSIKLNSAATLKSNSIVTAKELEIKLNSASEAILEVDVDELSVNVNSASNLELSGKCNFNDVRVNSASQFYAYNLKSKKVDARVLSVSKAEVFVEGELIAEVNSASKLTYKGNPEKVISDSNSGSKVRKY